VKLLVPQDFLKPCSHFRWQPVGKRFICLNDLLLVQFKQFDGEGEPEDDAGKRYQRQLPLRDGRVAIPASDSLPKLVVPILVFRHLFQQFLEIVSLLPRSQVAVN
jgi:hypothetical protein